MLSAGHRRDILYARYLQGNKDYAYTSCHAVGCIIYLFQVIRGVHGTQGTFYCRSLEVAQELYLICEWFMRYTVNFRSLFGHKVIINVRKVLKRHTSCP